jgi:hypothetical protein
MCGLASVLSRNKDKKCKHIIAVQTLQKTYEVESKIKPVPRPKICPKCFKDLLTYFSSLFP